MKTKGTCYVSWLQHVERGMKLGPQLLLLMHDMNAVMVWKKNQTLKSFSRTNATLYIFRKGRKTWYYIHPCSCCGLHQEKIHQEAQCHWVPHCKAQSSLWYCTNHFLLVDQIFPEKKTRRTTSGVQIFFQLILQNWLQSGQLISLLSEFSCLGSLDAPAECILS